MGITGIIINNFSEIIAMSVCGFVGYNLGVWKERKLAWLQLNPLRLFKRKA